MLYIVFSGDDNVEQLIWLVKIFVMHTWGNNAMHLHYCFKKKRCLTSFDYEIKI